MICVPTISPGTFSTVMSKIMYQTQGVGRFGQTEYFAKPLFQNWAMFLAMTGCLVIYEINKRRGTYGERMPLKGNNGNGGALSRDDPRVYYMVAVPAACDFIATYLMAVGLLWINASIWQMIRGSLVFFSALIRLTVLKKSIHNFQWFGIFMVMTALCVIGFACIQGSAESAVSTSTPTQKALGIGLVFLAQMVQACQTVIEEYLLHDIKATPMQVVGLEGFWGFILCTFVAMPFTQLVSMEGIHEDNLDTFTLVGSNPQCLLEAFVYVVVILGFNIFAMKLTQHLNAVTRNIIDTARTMFIWITLTVVHYTVSPDYGEDWNNWCWMQLGGFGILIFGLFTYYSVFELPCFLYPSAEMEEVKDTLTNTPRLTPVPSSVQKQLGMAPPSPITDPKN